MTGGTEALSPRHEFGPVFASHSASSGDIGAEKRARSVHFDAVVPAVGSEACVNESPHLRGGQVNESGVPPSLLHRALTGSRPQRLHLLLDSQDNLAREEALPKIEPAGHRHCSLHISCSHAVPPRMWPDRDFGPGSVRLLHEGWCG